jgi:NAD(P)-dependent dehydrogenase (short-subunit alcohol dehydrogenase family)
MTAAGTASVLVTGGGSGIGAATALHLARAGVRVTIAGRRQDALDRVVAQAGPNCIAVCGDITKADQRQAMVEAAVAHGGGLTGLVNNAANMLRSPVTALDEAAVMELFHTNVVAAMMLTGLAVPHLEVRGGAVVFVGSVHTRRAYPGSRPMRPPKGRSRC